MFDRVFGFGRIVASALLGDSKAVLVNLRMLEPDLVAPDNQAETTTGEVLYGGLGLVGRPDPANEAGACEVITARTDDGAIPIAVRDLRLNRRLNPKDGELGLVHYGGAFFTMKWNEDQTGSDATLLVPQLDGVDGEIAASHTLSMKTTPGDESVVLYHLKKQSLIMNADGDAWLQSTTGDHMVGVSDEGVFITGTMKLMGGVIAGDTTLAQEVALWPALAALAGSLTALLAAIDAALASASAPAISPTSGITAVQYAAFQTARTSCETAISAVTAKVTGASQTLKASPV